MAAWTIIQTPRGARLLQHRVVLSEILRHPGPTHTVVDLFAAIVAALAPGPRLALLGFAGGGMIAPLRAMGAQHHVDAVDISDQSFALFQTLSGPWAGSVRLHLAEASAWLHSSTSPSHTIIEDLSIPHRSDVIKPDLTWSTLPRLIKSRLPPNGLAVFNLLRPLDMPWDEGIRRITKPFRSAHVVLFQDFENRVVIAGNLHLSARQISHQIRQHLHTIRSRLTHRISIRTIP